MTCITPSFPNLLYSYLFTLKNQWRVVGKDQPDGTAWRLNKDRVASRGDEKLGLSDAQRNDARTLAGGEDGSGAVSDTHYRMVRNKPLLMIHSLEPKGEAVTGPIAAFGVSFPYGDYSTTINRSEEHTSELQSLMRSPYAVFCLKKKKDSY